MCTLYYIYVLNFTYGIAVRHIIIWLAFTMTRSVSMSGFELRPHASLRTEVKDVTQQTKNVIKLSAEPRTIYLQFKYQNIKY